MTNNESRRTFLRAMALSAAGLALSSLFPRPLMGLRDFFGSENSGATESRPNRQARTAYHLEMPKRALGSTGLSVSILALSGASFREPGDARSFGRQEETINRALDAGVTYIDTAPEFESVLSEVSVGNVARTRRADMVISTRTRERTYDGALRGVEQSLRRLQTDRIDVLQIDDVSCDRDLEEILGHFGAIRALERLQAEGVLRLIGVGGHRDPTCLLRAMQAYPFDVVTMPLNAADPHANSFQREALPAAVERGMGVIASNVTANDRIFREVGLTSLGDAMAYVYSFPISTAAVCVADKIRLEQHLGIALRFRTALSSTKLRSLESLTEPYGDFANSFKYDSLG